MSLFRSLKSLINTLTIPEFSDEATKLCNCLFQREHNETLAKLNFVLALVDCVVELARTRGTPLSALTESVNRGEPIAAPEGCRRAEQLVLLVRALQLLSSGLNLATQELKSGQLQPSSTVKNGKCIGCLNANNSDSKIELQIICLFGLSILAVLTRVILQRAIVFMKIGIRD